MHPDWRETMPRGSPYRRPGDGALEDSDSFCTWKGSASQEIAPVWTRPQAGLHGPIRWGRRGPYGHNAGRTPNTLLSGGRATSDGIGITPWRESSLISTTARWQPAAAPAHLRPRFSRINWGRLPVYIVDRLRSSHSCDNRFLPRR